MATSATGTLTVVAKNTMLNAWRTATNYGIIATNNAGDARSDKVQVSFNVASNGKITLTSAVTLTVQSGSDGTNAVKKLFVEPLASTGDQISFTITDAIEFPAGGSLIVNQLDVELEDPA